MSFSRGRNDNKTSGVTNLVSLFFYTLAERNKRSGSYIIYDWVGCWRTTELFF